MKSKVTLCKEFLKINSLVVFIALFLNGFSLYANNPYISKTHLKTTKTKNKKELGLTISNASLFVSNNTNSTTSIVIDLGNAQPLVNEGEIVVNGNGSLFYSWTYNENSNMLEGFQTTPILSGQSISVTIPLANQDNFNIKTSLVSLNNNQDLVYEVSNNKTSIFNSYTTIVGGVGPNDDFDDDGILNVNDIDDDNDGVKDAVESPESFYSIEELNALTNPTTELVFHNSYDISNSNDGDATSFTQLSPANQSIANKAVVVYDLATSLAVLSVEFEMGAYPFSRNSSSGVFKLQGFNGTNWIDLSNNKSATVVNGNETFVNINATFTAISKIRVFGVSGQANYLRINNVRINAFNLKPSLYTKTGVVSDTDLDGKMNHQDLDADGDGCSDAKESGATNDNATAFEFLGSVGSNGLADALETFADSGEINYVSTYSDLATDAVLNLCADSDNDGIGDLVDIDDDNDGIIDVLESCKDEYIVNGDFEDGNTGFTSAYTHVNGNVSPSQYRIGAYNLAVFYSGNVPTSTDDPNDPFGNAFLVDQGSNTQMWGQNITSLRPNTTYKFTYKVYSTHWMKWEVKWNDTQIAMHDLSTPGYGNNNPASWKSYEAIITTNANQTTGLLELSNLMGASEGTGVFDKLSLKEVNNSNSSFSCVIDTDGDGIPNRLDLDSDGDGCSDAKEASATTNDATDFAFTGAVGANGLVDALETIVDSGEINYDSTYTSLALNATLDACADSDGDGVGDLLDIDDDNDGILDVVENCKSEYIVNGDFNDGNTGFTSTYTHVNGNLAASQYRIGAYNLAVFYTGSVPTSTDDPNDPFGNAFLVDQGTNTQMWGQNITELSTNTSYTFSYKVYSTHWMKWEVKWNGTQIAMHDLSTPGHGNNSPGSWKTYTATFTTTTTQTTGLLELSNLMGAVEGTGVFDKLSLKRTNDIASDSNIICTLDTDEDGIPNSLDLDSDGDGCSDAKEANATTNDTADFVFTGAVGANGFIDALETSVDSGEINYDSTYLPLAINASYDGCADSDNDGIADLIDIDDDNDGVLDVLEQENCNSSDAYSCSDIDTDGDGIPNRLDLDSDGDGCSDAKEASATTNDSTDFAFTGAVGANGFIDALETSADSGEINYDSTYTSLALNATLDACADSDGDGVGDLVDIDDDNDGVLDVLEQQACSNGEISDSTSCDDTRNGDSWIVWENQGSGVATGTITINEEVIDVTMTGNNHSQLSSVYHNPLWSNTNAHCPATTNSAYTLSPVINNTGNYSLTFSKPIYLPRMHIWSMGAGSNRPSMTFDQNITLIKDYSITVNEATDVVKAKNNSAGGNGTIQFTDGYVSEINWVVTTAEHWWTINISSSAFQDSSLNNLGLCADIDTDEDGIPNRLDLDSDGDGCSDAKEASATTNDATDFAFTGAVGANGFIDALETSVDSGEINYDSTYTSLALNATLEACKDTDGDGVGDLVDIDDDNDGILDTLENGIPVPIQTAMDLSNAAVQQISNYSSSFQATNAIDANLSSTTITSGNTPTDWWQIDLAENKYLSKVTLSPRIANSLVNAYVLVSSSPFNGDNLQNAIDNADFVYQIPATASTNEVVINTPLASGQYIRIKNSGNNGNRNYLEIKNIKIYGAIPSNSDTDNDGIPNRLDLDSDGDGCSDAFESGATSVTLPFYSFTSEVGENGLADEKETSVDSGIVNYSSEYSNAIDGTISQGCVICDTTDLALDCDGDGNPNGTDPHPNVPTSLDDLEDANNEEYIAFFESDNVIDILANDDFLPSNLITITKESGGTANGTVTFEPITGTMSYLPTEDEINTTVTLIYRVSYNNSVSDTATVTMHIQRDSDKDGLGDITDLDNDNDGILDTDEGLVSNPNPEDNILTSRDTDGDGVPDYLDTDSDNDGIKDNYEAQNPLTYIAPSGYGASINDVNKNGLDDVYDPEEGGLAITPIDSDSDKKDDYLDLDSDDDTIADNLEFQATLSYQLRSNTDLNNNGLDDVYETDPFGNTLAPVDTDEDGIPDYLDIDSDNDEYFDIAEAQNANLDLDNDGRTDFNVGENGYDNSLEDQDDYSNINGPVVLGTITELISIYNDIDNDATSETGPLNQDVDFRDQSIPDFIPTLFVDETVINTNNSGSIDFRIFIGEYASNNIKNNSQVRLIVPFNPEFTIEFDPTSTSMNDELLNNPDWDHTVTAAAHIFTYVGNDGLFSANGASIVGVTLNFASLQNISGSTPFKVSVEYFSGGETINTNNDDFDYLNYFSN